MEKAIKSRLEKTALASDTHSIGALIMRTSFLDNIFNFDKARLAAGGADRLCVQWAESDDCEFWAAADRVLAALGASKSGLAAAETRALAEELGPGVYNCCYCS